jgi:hypothetical protein
MRRILVAGSSIVVLALAGFLAVGVGARTVGPVAHKPVASAHARSALAAGTTCYVSVARCSQVPCVEFIQSGTVSEVAPAVYLPAVARRHRCPPANGLRSQTVPKDRHGQSYIAPGYNLPIFQRRGP